MYIYIGHGRLGGGERRRGSHGALPYVLNVWPRYQPNPEHVEFYEGWCYAQMILHHKFRNTIGSGAQDWQTALKGNNGSWAEAYQTLCWGTGCYLHQGLVRVRMDLREESGD